MFDSDNIKALLEQYGPIGLLLAVLVVLNQIGLLDFDSLAGPLSTKAFCGGVICIITTILYYLQNISKKFNGSSSEVLEQTMESNKELKEEIKEFATILNAQNSQTSQIQYLVTNIYELVKGIPNKHLIFEILMIRTKYLMNNSLESILEYVVAKASPLDSDGIIRIQNSLERSLTRLKVDYMENILKISRNLIDNEESAEVESSVEKSMSKIYSILTEGNLKVEDVLFKVNMELKDLEDLLKNKYKAFIDIQISDPDYIL